ncbi:uncharacterized protein LOC130808714 [Amaranthus tricolor]|uniref:uncharacterized protein LOC130808714 n=1 Tax=Amaranthus tricolor TaxID=29722 RepID=UPI0025872558|nr:uncharacterized protein LOC130808714 [Amaranthus tricolor]
MGTYNCCTHPSLQEVNFGERFAFTCNGCRELGYGSCYTCQPHCNYHLHNICRNAPPTMSHPFFKQCQFVLDKSIIPPPKHHYYQGLENLCVACGTSVQGWRYVHTINGSYPIFMHPRCMTIPYSTLYTRLESIDCAHCRGTISMGSDQGVKGWGLYIEHGVVVHVKCVKEMLHKDWERRYYGVIPQYVDNNYNDREEHGQANQVTGMLWKVTKMVIRHSIYHALGLSHLSVLELASYMF